MRNFSAVRNCRVKYVVEVSEDRRKFVDSSYPKTRAIEELKLAMKDPEVNALIIATPATSHFAIAKQALECGKHIFVEKPLAMSVVEVDALISLAEKRELTVMAGHTFLYNAAVDYLRKLVASGELGKIYYLYAQRLNLGVIRSDVNAMWNLAPHDISILMHVLGKKPLAVCATGTDCIQSGIEDVVFLNLQFPDRVQASIHVSWLDPNKVRKTTVVGSKKMAVYDDVADDKIAIYNKGIDRLTPEMPFDEVTPQRLVHRAGDILLPRIEIEEPVKVEAAHFVDCILNRRPPVSGPQNARAVVAVLEAAHRSLKNRGCVVEVL